MEQFGKNFGLSYVIVETGHVKSDSAVATQVAQLLLGKLPEVVPAPPRPSFKLAKWAIPLLLLISPWLILGGLTLGVGGGLYCLRLAWHKGNWPFVLSCATVVDQLAQVASPLTPLVMGYPLQEFFTPARTLAQTLSLVSPVLHELQTYELALINPGSAAPPADTTRLTQLLTQLSEQLAYLQSQLQQASQTWPGANQFLPSVITGRQVVGKLSLVAPQLPQLVAVGGQSQWLVLLQDNTELRPTGGFIDGIGLVSLENGHLVRGRFLSSTQADSRLKGQVTPPDEVKKVLGETNWYLRDSNWDPDFPSSAARAAWFVEKELGQSVDAVVAINLTTLIELLKIEGSVNLPQFGGQISAQNWLANYLGAVKLDSADRFLPLLAGELFAKRSNASPDSLAKLLLTALETRQIQIWPLSRSAGLATAGWAGQLDPPNCGSPYACVNNFVYPVEANVGLNKVDPEISRQNQITVQVEPQQITTTYLLRLTHTGKEGGWPQGEYKDYLRLYLPSFIEVQQVSWGGQVVGGDKLVHTWEKGMQKLGILLTLVPGQTGQLVVVWRQLTPADPRWHYQLSLINQSGVAPYPAQIVMSYPSKWWSQARLTPQLATSGELRYNSLVDRLLRFNIDYVPTSP